LESTKTMSWSLMPGIASQMEECIPSKTTSTRITQPWITKDLRTLSRRKQKLYNRAKRTHKTRDWNSYNTMNFCMSAFFHTYILRFTGFWLDIVMLESTKTISWSLMPGIASQSKTTSTRITQPWITKDLCTLSRRKQKLYNRAKRTHKTKDWNSCNAIKKLAQSLVLLRIY
jgi:hypothetical protein